MPTLPPIAVVPMFVRCRWCEGVFRASTRWPEDDATVYRRCAWCARLTKIPLVVRRPAVRVQG